jgi:hypothetical protein
MRTISIRQHPRGYMTFRGPYSHTTVYHRYLMNRLSLQVFYLGRHVSSTAPPFILWWSNLEILFGPLHRSSPFIGELRCQAIQMEHGPCIAERTQKAVYIVRCLCGILTSPYRNLAVIEETCILVADFCPGWGNIDYSASRYSTHSRSTLLRFNCENGIVI